MDTDFCPLRKHLLEILALDTLPVGHTLKTLSALLCLPQIQVLDELTALMAEGKVTKYTSNRCTRYTLFVSPTETAKH